MIVDTSAVVAILLSETDAQRFLSPIEAAEIVRMSAANFVEAAIVAESQGGVLGGRHFDAFIRRAGIVIETVTEEQAHIARQAFLDYGKGRHKAGLNFGDCFAYALARATGEPLLFKGGDFRMTDVTPAL